MSTLQLCDGEYATEPDWRERVPSFGEEFERELESLRWNIRLLGPPIVFQHVEYSHVHLVLALLVANFPARYSLKHRRKVADDALRSWQKVSNTMRTDLRGDEETLQRFEREVPGHRQELHNAEGRIKRRRWLPPWPWNRASRARFVPERTGTSDYRRATGDSSDRPGHGNGQDATEQ
jgi:hypothetical protein